MSFVLILQFVLNGHVHTVNTGRAFSSQQECSVAGQQANLEKFKPIDMPADHDQAHR
jgi:hypothetical protein